MAPSLGLRSVANLALRQTANFLPVFSCIQSWSNRHLDRDDHLLDPVDRKSLRYPRPFGQVLGFASPYTPPTIRRFFHETSDIRR